jgi:hypothetical protein
MGSLIRLVSHELLWPRHGPRERLCRLNYENLYLSEDYSHGLIILYDCIRRHKHKTVNN